MMCKDLIRELHLHLHLALGAYRGLGTHSLTTDIKGHCNIFLSFENGFAL